MQFSEQFVLFMQHWTDFVEEHRPNSLVEHDPEWPSPCEDPEDVRYGFREVKWSPVRRIACESFSDLENAVSLRLHPDLWTFYGMFLSNAINVNIEGRDIELLQAWNDNDFARLQENIIGHLLMKQRLKQPATIFIGLTAQDDEIVSLNNDTGEVWVERVGKVAHTKIANNLSDFLSLCKFVE